jgi:peptide/nickel transport system substrate-binding protein
MFDLAYREPVPENIIGDLAVNWETSSDGMEITFSLHQGVKWHDGMPFTADDVVYSLDKMTDVNRSAISDWFPAYRSSEKIDDHTVKVHLKNTSAGFMISLAQGESQIQAKHLAGTNDQSGEFMIGTGPFVLEEFKVRVHLRWKRNPDYFKKDKYGNQLPYLDSLLFVNGSNADINSMLISRRLDIKSTVTGAATLDSWQTLTQGAPELLWQRREKDSTAAFFLNTKHPPLDDVRVRRALGLLIDEKDLLIGYSGDALFGITDVGLLTPSFGLPKEEVRKILGWDKPFEERVTEAQQLMAEAGYPDGFKLNILAYGTVQLQAGAALVFADALRKYLKIDSEVNCGLAGTEIQFRLDNDNYDLFAQSFDVGQDPALITMYVSSSGYANYSHYSNPELDKMLTDLDQIIDPIERREAIWSIEGTLLTDLPILPTGCFIANFMPYYPYVKNIRWIDMAYSNVNRLEDVWIDKDIYQQVHGKLPSSAPELVTAPAPTPAEITPPATTPDLSDNATITAPTPTPSQTTGDPYDNPDWPVIWVKIDPPQAPARTNTEITVTLKVPPGSLCDLTFINPETGTRSARKPANVVADADGNAIIGPWAISHMALPGEATLEVTVTKTDGSKITVTHPYMLVQ